MSMSSLMEHLTISFCCFGRKGQNEFASMVYVENFPTLSLALALSGHHGQPQSDPLRTLKTSVTAPIPIKARGSATKRSLRIKRAMEGEFDHYSFSRIHGYAPERAFVG
ncbi:hypothetical protein TNCV_1365031 [Trichonephila clavipes]|nr:hypothetical protein TNCV_1365031 [Trichonephila clavipes]